jgi:hypothetical protein
MSFSGSIWENETNGIANNSNINFFILMILIIYFSFLL